MKVQKKTLLIQQKSSSVSRQFLLVYGGQKYWSPMHDAAFHKPILHADTGVVKCLIPNQSIVLDTPNEC